MVEFSSHQGETATSRPYVISLFIHRNLTQYFKSVKGNRVPNLIHVLWEMVAYSTYIPLKCMETSIYWSSEM